MAMIKPLALFSSVALRAGILSTLWMSAVLIGVMMISAFFYRDANERNFERLLNAHLYSLIGAVGLSDTGSLQGMPELGDIRYNDPSSGWYWEVLLLDSQQDNTLKSPSLLGGVIASPPESELAFDRQFTRTYRARGLRGEEIVIVESDIVMEEQSQTGRSNRLARFRIMGNEAEVQNRLNDFWGMMRWYLAAFIVLSAVINALMILVGMRPLTKIKRALSAVRSGAASHIELDLPFEIQTMAREMNALIENQRHMVERVRTQLGNLAHAMKTPLAIIINEATRAGETGAGEKQENQLVLEQAKLMQNQIQHHLQRAQMAAQRGGFSVRSEVNPVVEKLVRVMGKLFTDKQIHVEASEETLHFAGETQDLEEIIGNLLENAGKWAKSTIWLRLHKLETTDGEPTRLHIVIEDDGAGLDEDKIEQALKRGQRLDESVPGSGLGLSIVAELVHEYRGTIQFDRSPFGGLRASLILPLTHSTLSLV